MRKPGSSSSIRFCTSKTIWPPKRRRPLRSKRWRSESAMTVLGYDVTADGLLGGARRGWDQLRDYLSRVRADRTALRKLLMYGGVALVAAVAAIEWLTGGRYVSSDDSYVHAAKLMVSK